MIKKDALKLVVVTGLSGSGKSTAIRALEDLGYYCVDNLPAVLIGKFVELCVNSTEELNRVGLCLDTREGEFFQMIPDELARLKKDGVGMTIIFLDSSDDTIIRRYSETRRKHPLDNEGSIRDGIAKEREILSSLRAQADIVIDTTSMNINQLKTEVIKFFEKSDNIKNFQINLLSFGYRFGIPNESDFVMDVRFLPNPYFSNHLKSLSGLNRKVINFITKNRETKRFLKQWFSLINYLLPLYKKEGKKYLTISVGCTGGRHRSVAIVETMKKHLEKKGYLLTVRHRDVDKI